MATDFFGRELQVGQNVIKAETQGRSYPVRLRKVDRINEKGRIFLNGSHVPVAYTGLLIIVDNEINSLTQEERDRILLTQ